MKHRFILYQRNNGKFYAEDTGTKKQVSLKTRDHSEAETLLHSKNEAFRQPVLNLQIVRTYLSATDASAAKRTSQTTMDEMTATKAGEPLPFSKGSTIASTSKTGSSNYRGILFFEIAKSRGENVTK